MKKLFRLLSFFALSLFPLTLPAQMITGVWHGKINNQKVEVKIIQNGDSLTGTSYYYNSPDIFRRYSIKGYFNKADNSTVWWDDQLLEEKTNRISLNMPGKIPLLSTADFNCPGGDKMMLDGSAVKKDNDKNREGSVRLVKTNNTQFTDEWDFIIDNYTTGTNDPELIDSISLASKNLKVTSLPEKTKSPGIEKTTDIAITPVKKPATQASQKVLDSTITTSAPVTKSPSINPIAVIEEKFVSRKKELIKSIPLSGDSIELRFYDNAEIDGDSISLFLNDKLIFSHIRLTGNAYSIKLAVAEMWDTNELIMVAENLGTIPPNTSYMVAIVDNKRYGAYLASTEGSSAMVSFFKETKN